MKRIRRFVCFCFLTLLTTQYCAAQVNSNTLFETAVRGISSPDCVEYCVIGVCLSIVCNGLFCQVETTPWIRHRAPDIAVSSHSETGDGAWDEARALYGGLGKETASALVGIDAIGATGGMVYASKDVTRAVDGQNSRNRNPSSLLHFKEVHYVGSPTGDLLENISGFCTAQSDPFVPYFISELDAFEWRFGLLELLYPASSVPGLREISQSPLTTWGSVHPRTAWVYSEHRARAAAVAAQRAADIVTRDRQPHVYIKQNGDTGRSGSGVYTSNEKTDRWQMVYPQADQACYAFGNPNSYLFNRNREDQKFVFLYWQNRDCCPFANGSIFNKISFDEVCT